MARCEICDKDTTFGMNVSHSHRRTSKIVKANVQTVKTNINGTPKKVKVCARCLRSGKVERA